MSEFSPSRPVVRIRGVKKSFCANRVLDGVDFDVHKGEVVVVIGPSGSGKTTLLRCINLLETYDEGSIQVDGVEVGFRDRPGGARHPGATGSCPGSGPTSAWCSNCSTCFPI